MIHTGEIDGEEDIAAVLTLLASLMRDGRVEVRILPEVLEEAAEVIDDLRNKLLDQS